MKRKSKFVIALLSAVVTFTALCLTVGKPTLFKHHGRHACYDESNTAHAHH